MLLYSKLIDENTKQCEVGLGTNIDFYKSLGYTEQEVEEYNGEYYLRGYTPKPDINKLKDELLKELKNNIETYIYNQYPIHKQCNIAIYGTEEERQTFKQFKEYNTDIYHNTKIKIESIKTVKKLNSIDISLNIFGLPPIDQSTTSSNPPIEEDTPSNLPSSCHCEESPSCHCEEQNDEAISHPEYCHCEKNEVFRGNLPPEEKNTSSNLSPLEGGCPGEQGGANTTH